MREVILINPRYPAERRVRYGMLDSPLNPKLVPASLRRESWWVCGATFVLLMIIGSSLGPDSKPMSPLLAWPLTLLVFALLFAPYIAGRLVKSERVKARLRVVGAGPDSSVVAGLVAKMQVDAIRFHTNALAQPRLTRLANDTAVSLGWLLWHSGARVTQISAVEREITAAGPTKSGPAKRAWVAERRDRIAQLRAPVVEASAQVTALADLAEDTVWAMRLAREKTTLGETFTPTGPEVRASGDIGEAMATLAVWHQTWAELDDRLRAIGEDFSEGDR